MAKHKLKVVIIDDSKADIAIFKRYLSKDPENEFEIIAASNGSAGIALIQQERPDCALLDYRLPDMTGLDILDKVRREFQIHSVPVVMLTGSVDESLVVEALKSGAQDYLSKSALSSENLLRAIHNAIEKVHVLRRMEEALLARDEFLSIASHELKTPLTTMTLQMQLGLLILKSTEGESLPREKLKLILTRADAQLSRLSLLVNDLLDLSRISSGRLDFNADELDLVETVRGVTERMSENFAAVQCEVTFAAPGAVVGTFDRFRLEQVIVNLVSNAIKYAGGKPVHVAVLREADWAIVHVRDEGPGIGAEQQKTIFDRFDRGLAPKSTTGLGLGLYIAKQIVDLHQGTITVHSAPGQGATFTVRLPLAPAPLAPHG